MPENKPAAGEQVFGEADVAEILERAIKLDGARDAHVTVEQLREAALEVGVSPAAFSQALAEFSREHTPAEEATQPSTPAPRFRSAVRTGLAVAFGAILGGTAGLMAGPYLSGEMGLLAAILLAGASLRLVLSHKKEKALLPYVLDVIWLWSSFMVALGLAAGPLEDDILFFAVIGIFLASVIGGTIIKLAGKDEAKEATRTIRIELTGPRKEETD